MNYLKGLLFALALPIATFAQVDTNSQHFYLFVYFDNSVDQDGARLAVSSDAKNWQLYNDGKPVIVPILSDEHRMRDPNIYFDAKTGIFHMVWTVAWKGQNIGYARTKDLRKWSTAEQVLLPVSSKVYASVTWAPEIYYDDIKDSLMVYWSLDDGVIGKRIYYSMTKDFRHFTAPTKFFDPGYTVIDATILKVAAGDYYMFFKDERSSAQAGQQAKNLHLVHGPTPQGPFSAVSKALTSVGTEGPTSIKIGNEYRVYFDPYNEISSPYRMIKVTDLTTTVSPWPQGDTLKTVNGLFNFSHGTIMEIPKVKALELLYDIPDPTSYQAWAVDTLAPLVFEAPPAPTVVIPLGKRNCGCGTGVGLAFFPPLFFKLMAGRKRRKAKRSIKGKS